MTRPVTLFTGQWTDLGFKELCQKARSWGYEGLEPACAGDHLDPQRAAADAGYANEQLETLHKQELGCWCIGAHTIGQCIGDEIDSRHDAFVPEDVAGKPKEIRSWAIDTMTAVPAAAKNLGIKVVSGFMGSPIWKYFYSFPPTTEQMIDDGYKQIVELWSPIFDEFDRQGIRFGLEVHPTEIAFDVYTMHRLLEAFGHRKTLGVNYDPSHLIWQGMKPELFIREFPDRIYHVHMKDAAVTLDGKSSILASHLPFGDLRRGWDFRSIGHGDVDFDAIIRELNVLEYTGPLSIEWEDNGMDREFGASESCDYVKKVNFMPSTIAFDSRMGSQ